METANNLGLFEDQPVATKLRRLTRQRNYADCGKGLKGGHGGVRFIQKSGNDKNTVTRSREYFEGQTATGYKEKDEYEYRKGRKPSGKHIYYGSRRLFYGGRCGYLTNGELVVEGGCKKRIFDRCRTGTKRVRTDWGSPDDDIAQAIVEGVNEYEMYTDFDDELEYEDLEDEKL